MTPITSAYFKSLFPELAGEPDAVVDAWANVVGVLMSSNVFPATVQDLAQALLVAHNLTLNSQRGAGPVTSDRVGDISTSNASMPTDKTAMSMTTYGRRFLDLARSFKLPTMFVGGSGPVPPPFGGYQPTFDRRPPFTGA